MKIRDILGNCFSCLAISAAISAYNVVFALILIGEVKLVKLMKFLPNIAQTIIIATVVIFTILFILNETFEILYYLRYRGEEINETTK